MKVWNDVTIIPDVGDIPHVTKDICTTSATHTTHTGSSPTPAHHFLPSMQHCQLFEILRFFLQQTKFFAQLVRKT